MSYQESEEKGIDVETNEEPLILVSMDGERFNLKRSTATLSEYIKGVIDLDSTASEIELQHIKSETARKIIEWLEYHENMPPKVLPRPLKTANLRDAAGDWDANFVDCELEQVFEVLLAANFLMIVPLLELCCAKVASLMLGKTPKQIRKAFNIREDFTPEEEQKIRKEFAEFL